MIEYQKILDKNMLNVFKDILINIRDNDDIPEKFKEEALSRIIYKVAIDQKFMHTDVLNVGSNANNFTKHQIVEKIEKYLKKPMITIINKSKVDRRNYKVNFSKLKKLYKIYPKYSVDYGINELLHAFKSNIFNFSDENTYGNYLINEK